MGNGMQKKFRRRGWIRIALIAGFLGGLALAVYMTESPPILTPLPEVSEGLIPVSPADAEVTALAYLEANGEALALEVEAFIHREIGAAGHEMVDRAVRVPTEIVTPAVVGAITLDEIQWTDTRASVTEGGYWTVEATAEVPGVVSYSHESGGATLTLLMTIPFTIQGKGPEVTGHEILAEKGRLNWGTQDLPVTGDPKAERAK